MQFDWKSKLRLIAAIPKRFEQFRIGGASFALELEVLGFVDHTHSAGAELAGDPVVGYGLADHKSSLFSPCDFRFSRLTHWS